LNAFLKRLAGLVKFALIHHLGMVDLSSLAAGTGQREVTTRRGLEWLARHGDIQIISSENNRLKLDFGNGLKGNVANLTEEIKALLEETAAFRSYLRNVNSEIISFSE
jgi:hypothetical protein